MNFTKKNKQNHDGPWAATYHSGGVLLGLQTSDGRSFRSSPDVVLCNMKPDHTFYYDDWEDFNMFIIGLVRDSRLMSCR